MPYTVAVSMDRFYDNINLSGDHRETANKRRDDVVNSLKKRLNVVESFASGSIPRYTALKESADLDVMVALHYSEHIKDKLPSQVLQSVRDTLSEFRTNVRKNGQAVTLYYKTWPNVDIVPCSRLTDSNGNVTGYNIPDMNSETWIESRPKAHTSNLTARAGTCGLNFRRLITIAKHWNKRHGSYLQSYHIEALAMNIFTTHMDDIPWHLLQFFDQSVTLVSSLLWYEGGFVDHYLSWSNRSEAIKRLETARDKARDAWYKTYGENDDHEGAIGVYRQMFGDKFPAYG